MDDVRDSHSGLHLLSRLSALARARRARGDSRLFLNPSLQPEEFFEFDAYSTSSQGLVLEPRENANFEIKRLSARRKRIRIGGYCDGTRATYALGFEDVYPLLYTENLAAARTRDPVSGYHGSYYRVQRSHVTLLAPFGLFPEAVRLPYERLALSPTRYADLCWAGDSDEPGITPDEMRRIGSVGWQERGRRRARRLMEISEQVAALSAARVVRDLDPSGESWLLQDGSLFQFDRHYLREREPLRQIVASVKSHPVPFFGVAGERMLASMRIGERSAAFLPRPPVDDARGSTARQIPSLAESPRPMVSWYLRVREPEPGRSDRLSGVVRLDIAAVADWCDWVDDVSWAVLDEFYGLSARPDSRYDVMPYGIHECEHFLHAQRLAPELLLARLSG